MRLPFAVCRLPTFQKRGLLIIALLCAFENISSQELFVFSEPASNMPARSIAARVTAFFPDSKFNNYFKQRYMPEVMVGISKNIMVHARATFSDYYYYKVNLESGGLYAQWRFYSNDEVHRHFRVAAYVKGAYSNSPFIYGDINLDGDNTGVQGGLIATQLLNKLAISGTAGYIKVFTDNVQHASHDGHPLSAVKYSLSAGYLLFPRDYADYKQPNLNIYMEMLGMKGIGKQSGMLDLAPALQLILNSNLKINLGYRFQVRGDMLRVGERTWQIGLERTFLGVF